MSVLSKVKHWYEGERRFYDNPPGASVVILGWTEERHWTARIAHKLVEFWFAEWKWVLGTVVALVGLFIAYKKL